MDRHRRLFMAKCPFTDLHSEFVFSSSGSGASHKLRSLDRATLTRAVRSKLRMSATFFSQADERRTTDFSMTG